MTFARGDPTGHPLGTSRIVRTGDGRKLHMMEQGESPPGAPAVLFEAGLAAPRSYWGLVAPAISRWAHTIVYDRAGLGRSEIDREPRTLARMADDLGDLMDALGAPSFVLVAHSGGALVARAVAGRHPERIAGLILVDPTDEGCAPVFSRTFRFMEQLVHHASCLLARFGLLERLFRGQIAPLPQILRTEFSTEAFTRTAMRTRGAELGGMIAAMNDLRHTPPSPVDYPVTVISGGEADPGMSASLRTAFNASHARRARLSTAGRHVIAERSGHFIPLTEPEVIIAEIGTMLEKIDGRTSSAVDRSSARPSFL